MHDEDEGDDEGPEMEVWGHLSSAIEYAEMEFQVLEPDARTGVKELGRLVAQARTSLVQQSGSTEDAVLQVEEKLLANPWIRHAAEIEIASEAIDRANHALERYLSLRPAIAARSLPPRAASYVAEVIHTFALGFDAACIALCRATLEQVLKDALIQRAIFTEARIKREKPTADTLLKEAKRAGLLRSSVRAAEQIVDKGNTIMHKFIYDVRVREQQGRDSVEQLIQVLGEVLGSDGDTLP